MKTFDPYDIDARERLTDEERLQREIRRQRDEDDFNHVMSSPEGRRYVWRLLERTGVFRSSYTGNSETFFREGQRNVGLMVLADVHAVCPERYQEMLNEQQGEK